MINGKSVGPDGIAPETIKYCNFDDIIIEHANRVLIDGKKPTQWYSCNIMPIPKADNLIEVNNYRGIALSTVALKVTNKIILNIIHPFINPLLRNNQNGVRLGSQISISTTTHLLALQRLIEWIKSHNMKAIITFVDFRKAFIELI